MRARELVRIVLGDLAAGWEGPQVRQALSDLTDAYLEGALGVATRRVLARRGEEAAAAVLVVGMGRLGGREVGYASDADVMYVYDTLPGADPERAAEQATAIITELRKGLTGTGRPVRRSTSSSTSTSGRRPRCRSCRAPAPTRCSSWTPPCDRRARPARSCAAWRATAATTSGGRPAGSRRRCCGPGPSRATPRWGRRSRR